MNLPDLKYLKQLLDSPEELKHQIDKIRNSPDIDAAVKGFIALYDQQNGDIDSLSIILRKNRDVILSPLVKEHQNRKLFRRKFFYSAATLIILILGSLAFKLFQNTSENTLFANRYNDPGLPNFMNYNNQSSISKVMYLYKKGDFEEAKSSINELRKKKDNDTLYYYSAIIDYKLQNYTSASRSFENLIKTKGKYTVQSHYFNAICYAEQEKYKTAILNFKYVINSEQEPYTSLAKSHISELQQNLE